jgi:hypothetical protein
MEMQESGRFGARADRVLRVFIAGVPWDSAKPDEFATLTEPCPSIVMGYQDWAHPTESGVSIVMLGEGT